jgi:hypothetical protein
VGYPAIIAQFQLKDQPKGRWIQLKNGKISSRAGMHANPDFRLFFKNAKIAESFLTPPFDHARAHRCGQELQDRPQGPDALAVWFMQTLARASSRYTWKSGTDMGNGVTRYTNGTNGGPIFVYVKDGKILRTTPIDFDDTMRLLDDQRARQDLQATRARPRSRARHVPEVDGVFEEPHPLPDEARGLRPDGERNIQNRGKSKFVRISWEEARTSSSKEIKRARRSAPARSASPTARTTSGATSATTSAPSTVSGT